MSQNPKIEHHTFEYLRKTLIQVHNRNVRREFHDVQSPDNTPRSALNQSCLIRPRDPMGTILMRLGLFYLGLGHIDKIVTTAPPEIYDIRKEQNIPQLVMIWRQDKGIPTQYRVSIPHYDGIRHPTMPTTWHKGDQVATLWMKDNSYIRLYAKTEKELERLVTHFHQYIAPGHFSHTSIGKRKGDPIKPIVLHPVKAEYYQHGVAAQQPTWTCYFDAAGVCR